MYSKTAEVCQYSQALEESVNDFADFSMKITYGDYSSNDVSLSDLNFSALDNMENVYQSYKQQIETTYEGDEQIKHLGRLDEAYDNVFEEKVINPVKSAFDDKFTFFRLDNEETVKSIWAASTSKERLRKMISGYAENVEYKEELLGLKKDGKDTEWSQIM